MNSKSNYILVLKLVLVFIFVAVPFKVMILIPGFTEIRPANALNMLFGLLFGFQGALACGIGNIIADILGGTLAISSWAGFAANFLGTYLAYVLWYKISKEEPTMKNMKQVFLFIILSIVIAFIMAGIVTFGVAISYSVDAMALFNQVFINTVAFSIILGMPLVIVLKEVYHVKCAIPYNKERRKTYK